MPRRLMVISFYEDLRTSATIKGSSDRQFGLVFALVFAVLGLWPLRAGGQARLPGLAVAGVFLILAIVRPAFLNPMNKAWTLFGVLLGRIVNPIVTAVLFILVFTPAGLLSRFLGKDPLRLQREPTAQTYWIVRQPPGPQPATMLKQF